jgi:formate hydrogenlyase subunit 3/multisubunit Na+/H+ antiporter MnhD subunit
MDLVEILLALAPGLPALLALLWPVGALRGRLMGLAPWAALPALALALHPEADGTSLLVPALFTGLHLNVDGMGRSFLLLTALLWVVAGAFARSYHASDLERETFFGFFTLTMAGNLGLVLAADLLSFYLFFAWMTFAAYGLVVHRRDEEALRAGRIYIVLAVLGELCILSALIVLGWAFNGIPLFGGELDLAWRNLAGFGAAGLVGSLAVAGFGIKAGVAPLHLWLPLAHPVAPTAASALLSGVMIKAGVLAWLRFLPGDQALPVLGTVLLAVGVVSAFYGVLVGLAQDDPKTVLAYSSVSQMGYMAMGTGLALRAPEWAPVALVAVVLYAVHHGVAKGALFLSVGVADRWGEAGGGRGGAGASWFHRPGAVLVGAALPALALAGAPFTGGAQGKGLLKNALSELAPEWYPWLDPLLLVAAVGTTVLMARFLATLRRRMLEAADGTGPGSSGAGPSSSSVAGGIRGGGWSSIPWGLTVPWGLLVVLGVLGPTWAPEVVALPDGVAIPGAFYGLVAATGPVLVGTLAAWLVWTRPALLGTAGRLRVPAGDLLIPLEWSAARVLRVPEDEVVARVVAHLRRLRSTQIWSHGRAAWGAERDLYLARGPVVAFLLLVIALALVGLLG